MFLTIQLSISWSRIDMNTHISRTSCIDGQVSGNWDCLECDPQERTLFLSRVGPAFQLKDDDSRFFRSELLGAVHMRSQVPEVRLELLFFFFNLI